MFLVQSIDVAVASANDAPERWQATPASVPCIQKISIVYDVFCVE